MELIELLGEGKVLYAIYELKHPESMTEIMKVVDMTFAHVHKCIRNLKKKDFIIEKETENRRSKTFVLTPKGEETALQLAQCIKILTSDEKVCSQCGRKIDITSTESVSCICGHFENVVDL